MKTLNLTIDDKTHKELVRYKRKLDLTWNQILDDWLYMVKSVITITGEDTKGARDGVDRTPLSLRK